MVRYRKEEETTEEGEGKREEKSATSIFERIFPAVPGLLLGKNAAYFPAGFAGSLGTDYFDDLI